MTMVKIRALVDNLTTLNCTLMKGQEGDCPADRAKVLVARGLAEQVEGEELRIPGPAAAMVPARGDVTERATSRTAEHAERQTKKG